MGKYQVGQEVFLKAKFQAYDAEETLAIFKIGRDHGVMVAIIDDEAKQMLDDAVFEFTPQPAPVAQVTIDKEQMYYLMDVLDHISALLEPKQEIVGDEGESIRNCKCNPVPLANVLDWNPHVGNWVLVKSIVSERMDDDGDYGMYPAGKVGDCKFYAPRSAIVGPAPVRARFAVGDVVVHRHKLFVGVITREEHDQHYYTVEFDGIKWDIIEDNLLTFDEARERLAK